MRKSSSALSNCRLGKEVRKAEATSRWIFCPSVQTTRHNYLRCKFFPTDTSKATLFPSFKQGKEGECHPVWTNSVGVVDLVKLLFVEIVEICFFERICGQRLWTSEATISYT